ncbi:hypothetical protein RUM43_011068 [Polyplax serrata]|uniref:Cilia- and flagella-associated protein 251 n=1 Tax=Polyplax serrata TaxID=468196 RepID=A0AAN8PU64_POLSC
MAESGIIESNNSTIDEVFQEKLVDWQARKKSESYSNISPDDSASKHKITKEVDFAGDEEQKHQHHVEKYSDDDEEDNHSFSYEEGDLHQIYDEDEASAGESSLSSDVISNVYTKLSPFTIKWAFGIKTTVDIINLTTTSATEIFYVSSHFGVIYNYRTHKMEFLPGHNFPIQSISADASGRWLVSADAGEDTVIIIWDSQKRIPVWCLYNVFAGGVKYVKISPDARFLAAINCDFNYSLKFWQWTLGDENPDGILEIDPTYGVAKHIVFNHKKTEQFAITMKHGVTFCEWIESEKVIKQFTPQFEQPKKKIGTFRETIFLDDNHTALSATNTGYLVVWCDTSFSEPIPEGTAGTIEKYVVKCLRIHSCGITSLHICDGVLISSSEDGQIFFHDQYLRLVYLIPKLKLDPIMSISFNVADSETDPFVMENKLCSDHEISGINETGNKYKNEIAFPHHNSTFYAKVKRIPSDCTVEMRPFVIRDFVFLTKTGKTGYLSHRRKRIKYFLYKADSHVLALACNPNKSHLVVSYSSGWLYLYHYLTKKSMVSATIPGAKVTSMAYSNMGHNLFAGTDGGSILVLDSVLLTVLKTVVLGRSPILKIRLSNGDDYLACYDQQSCVFVFSTSPGAFKKTNITVSKYISHYKPINDLLFEELVDLKKSPRLFSLGEDRMLVEYDLSSVDAGKLKLTTVSRIEQTAIPLCFTWEPRFHHSTDFLISNSEYKLKIVESESLICKKTTLGPTADTPIVRMYVLPEHIKEQIKSAKMIYSTDRHIGIKILPATGNPFEGMGMVAHPTKITDLAISQDHNYVFTAGQNDNCVLMWEMNAHSVDVAVQMGGTGLDPFLSLIEGGPNSFFFREIEDFFYYAQIIHQGEDPNLDRSVSKSLALCEIPDLFRALGYYPTDYEVDNLLHELKHLKYNETNELITEVCFEECIKAFLNHKPVHGISLSHINKALITIADMSDPTDILVERSELYKALENSAEAMDHREVLGN